MVENRNVTPDMQRQILGRTPGAAVISGSLTPKLTVILQHCVLRSGGDYLLDRKDGNDCA